METLIRPISDLAKSRLSALILVRPSLPVASTAAVWLARKSAGLPVRHTPVWSNMLRMPWNLVRFLLVSAVAVPYTTIKTITRWPRR